MRHLTIEAIIHKVAVVIVAVLSVLTAAAVGGWMSRTIVAVTLMAGGTAIVAWLFWAWRVREHRWSQSAFGALVVLCALSAMTAIFMHDFPRGRDDAGYVTAGVTVAQEGSVSFSDIMSRLYHPYRAVGDDVFTSQFLPGYTVALAGGYDVGGLTGLFFVNALLLFVGCTALSFLARRLGGRRAGLAALLIYGTLYTTLWFSRRTLSETLFMTVTFVALWSILAAVQERRARLLGDAMLALSFLPLIRPEGISIAAAGIVVILILIIARFRSRSGLGAALAGLALAAANTAVFVWYATSYGQEYLAFAQKTAGSAASYLFRSGIGWGVLVLVAAAFVFRRYWRRPMIRRTVEPVIGYGLIVLLAVAEAVFLLWSRGIDTIDWSVLKLQYVAENFLYYGILPLAVIVLIGIARRTFGRWAGILLIVILPTFIFLVDPNIAVDQPWFMRRFAATIIPAIVIGAAVVLAKILPKRVFPMAVGALLLMNLMLASPIAFWRDNAGITDQIASFSQKYGGNDLFLMTPGWHWQQWGYTLHYVYGLDVLPNLDGFDEQGFRTLVDHYDAVYIISDRTATMFPTYNDTQLDPVDTLDLTYDAMQPTAWLASYVDENVRALDLERIRREWRGTPPSIVKHITEDLTVYRVDRPSDIVWEEAGI